MIVFNELNHFVKSCFRLKSADSRSGSAIRVVLCQRRQHLEDRRAHVRSDEEVLQPQRSSTRHHQK